MSPSQLDRAIDPAAASSGEVVRLDARKAPSRVELRARLCGVGMWTPAYPSFEAWRAAGLPDDLHATPAEFAPPPAQLLHPRLRRRTSTLTRAAVTALEAALAHGRVPIDAVRLVLVSSFGEIETTVDLLAQLGDPEGPISPTKFHNSVHNTATGYLSIASGNQRESTALAGGPHNLEVGLLEVLAGLAETEEDVVLIFAEELLPRPFDRSDADPTFAVALHLRPVGAPLLDSDLELRLSSRAPAPRTATGPAGLPTMVAPIVELLRAVANAGKRPISLAPDAAAPGGSVETEWTATISPLPATST